MAQNNCAVVDFPNVGTDKPKVSTFLLPQVFEVFKRAAIADGRTRSAYAERAIYKSMIADGLITQEDLDRWTLIYENSKQQKG